MNESVQSFIFRTQWKMGIFDGIGVIGTNGLWLNKPFVPLQQLGFYSHLDEKYLLTLLRNSGLAIESENLFSDPSSYVDILNSVFFRGMSGSASSKGHVSVSFCFDCILEDINEFGFGYFHKSWLSSDRCEIHCKALEFLPDLSRNNSIEWIGEILRGIRPSIDTNVEQKKLAPKTPSSMHYLTKMAPCSEKKLRYWLRKNSHKFGNELILQVMNGKKNKWNQLFYYKDGRAKYLKQSDVQNIFIAMSQFEKRLYEEFIDSYLRIEKVFFGVQMRDTFSERYAVCKNADCMRCEDNLFKNCSKDKSIIRYALEDKYMHDDVYLNPCDFFLENSFQIWESPLGNSSFKKRLDKREHICRIIDSNKYIL